MKFDRELPRVKIGGKKCYSRSVRKFNHIVHRFFVSNKYNRGNVNKIGCGNKVLVHLYGNKEISSFGSGHDIADHVGDKNALDILLVDGVDGFDSQFFLKFGDFHFFILTRDRYNACSGLSVNVGQTDIRYYLSGAGVKVSDKTARDKHDLFAFGFDPAVKVLGERFDLIVLSAFVALMR